jgi:F-type H+-transporting ATPase subunit b
VNINVTLLGQMITFSLLVYFTMKKVWPPIMQAMQERQKRIADGLAAAERGAHAQELAQEKASQTIKQAKVEAAEVLAQAQKRANEIIEEAKSQGREEGDRQITAAVAEIAQETNRAKEQLRDQVSALAVAGAEKVLQREIDAKAHGDLLKSLAAEI